MLSACSRPPSAPVETRPPLADVRTSFDVQLDSAGNLAIEASFTGPVRDDFTVRADAVSFVDDVRISELADTRQVAEHGGRWSIACAGPCRARYRFRLRDAAKALHDEQIAFASGDVILAPPPTWLLQPTRAHPKERVRFRVRTEPGQHFVTGVRASATPATGAFEQELSRFHESSFTAFGPLSVHHLELGGATLAIAPGIAIPDDVLAGWVRREIAAVDGYLGVSTGSVLVLLLASAADSTRGVTLGGGGASSLIRLGARVTSADLDDDWVLAHELIHTRFPALHRKHSWLSEGVASYIEPFARVRAGLWTKEKLWRDLLDGMPQGLPTKARGLDDDHTWGRIYWGGSLYFLLADLEIRERTGGAHTLEDALRAVTRTGADVEVEWPISKLLSVADEATGTNVFHALYERLALAPGSEDLERLWARLGIVRTGTTVRFDDSAPSARTRRAMTD